MGIRDVAGRALNTVTSAATKAEQAAEKKVEQAVAEVPQGWTSKAKALDPRPMAKSVATTVQANVASTTGALATEMTRALSAAQHGLANGMTEAHGLLNQASTALSAHGPVANELKSLGASASGLAERAKTAAVNEAGTLATDAANLAHKATGVWDKAKALEGKVEAGAAKGLELGKKGVDKVIGAATGYVNKVRAAVDYGKNIDQLGAGDSYRLGVGASGSIEGVKGYGQGSISVSKGSDGKYTVAADGELGGGVYAQIGASAGGSATASAAATLGVGGRVELKFDNAEDAKKATGILLKQAAASGLEGVAGPAGALAGAAVAPNAADEKFISDHASAVELRGNVAAQVSAALGLKNVVGLAGFAKVKGEDTVRLELSKPPKVVLRQELSGQVSGSAGIKLGKPSTDGARKKQATGAEGSVLGSARVQQTYTLPEQLDLGKLKSDPVGTLTKVAGAVAKTEQDSVSFTLDASGGALGHRGGVVATASYTGDAGALASSGALQKLFSGDLKGALTAATSNANITLAVTPYENVGVKYMPAASVMGFGLGGSFDALRKDVRRPPLYEYSGGDPAANQRAIDQLGKIFEQPQN